MPRRDVWHEQDATVDPSGCAAKIADIHGDTGRRWLARLPDLVEECARRWSLTILPPFGELSYNYVTPAVRLDGMPVVLKAGVPGTELTREAQALYCFCGEGMVRLLECDLDLGVLLLERLIPGTPLSDLEQDEEAARIAVRVLQRLWKVPPANHSFATVAGWASGLHRLRQQFGGGCGPLPSRLVDRAEGFFRELLGAKGEEMLLHGDLHPVNILRAAREPWLAIDPKGVVGDPVYDAATFVNGLSRWRRYPRQKPILDRQATLIASLLGFDRQKVLAWGLAQAVLAGWWHFEDHGRGWEPAFALAGLYEALLSA